MIDILIIFLAFALVHSIIVARWFKLFCKRALGETFMRAWYRLLYTLASIVTAGTALWLISRVPDRHFWTAPPVLFWPLRGLQTAGLVLGTLSFRNLDGMEFLGLRQVWRYLARGEVSGNLEGMTGRPLVTGGAYGIVRHPLYVAGLIIFTFSPVITVNGLAVTVLADLYFLFGMFIEERRFLQAFGDDYRRYMRQVPRMFPRSKLFRMLALPAAVLLFLLTLMVFRPAGQRPAEVADRQALNRIIGPDREILAKEIGRLFPAWLRTVRTADPRFDPSLMRHETTDAIGSPLMEQDAAGAQASAGGDARRACSPDGSRYLVLADGAEAEPDTELSIVDIAKGERRRLFFYGPATHIEGVTWIDRETVVAVGSDALTDPSPGREGGTQPVVWIIRLREDLISTYAGGYLR